LAKIKRFLEERGRIYLRRKHLAPQISQARNTPPSLKKYSLYLISPIYIPRENGISFGDDASKGVTHLGR
jgi:hypothetical protein